MTDSIEDIMKNLSPEERRNKARESIGDDVDAWTQSSVDTYLMLGTLPPETKRGNWVFDARRTSDITLWSTDTLLDYMEGHLDIQPKISEDVIWNEIYRRYNASRSWIRDDVKAFALTGKKPETNADGLLVNDLIRDDKILSDLSYAELRAGANGTINVKFSKEDLIDEITRRDGIVIPTPDAKILEQAAEKPTMSLDNTILKSSLERYKQALLVQNHKRLTQETIATQQMLLYRCIRNVLKTSDYTEFSAGWNIILDFVKHYESTLFSYERIHQGWGKLTLSLPEITLFGNLLTLLYDTRDPASRRSNFQKVALTAVFKQITSDIEVRNLTGFYE